MLGLITEPKPAAPPRTIETFGFPGIPIRDARSAEWALTSALSRAPNVREHGFQMHHYHLQARGPAYELAV
jgi:hypothetical protein